MLFFSAEGRAALPGGQRPLPGHWRAPRNPPQGPDKTVSPRGIDLQNAGPDPGSFELVRCVLQRFWGFEPLTLSFCESNL